MMVLSGGARYSRSQYVSRPTKKQLEDLANQIKQDQAKANPAEKRLKISYTFKNAMKMIARAKPPKKAKH